MNCTCYSNMKYLKKMLRLSFCQYFHIYRQISFSTHQNSILVCRGSICAGKQRLYGYCQMHHTGRNTSLHTKDDLFRRTFCLSLARTHYLQKRLSSSLFVSGISKKQPVVDLDLSIEKRIAQRQKLVKNLKLRAIDFDVNTFIEDYMLYKRLHSEKHRLENERQSIGKQMSDLINEKKSNKITKDEFDKAQKELMTKGQQVKQAHRELLVSYWIWEEKVFEAALKLPTDLRFQTPEEELHILASRGELPDLSVERNHLNIVRAKSLVKFSCVGPKAYYLSGVLATHEQSLLQSVSNHLTSCNFQQFSCPEIFRTTVAEGCGIDYKDRDKIFTLKDKESAEHKTEPTLDNFSHIRGVSLLSFAGYLTKTVVGTQDLPYRMFAAGRQYFTESESDLPGLFGVTQSMKVVTLSACPDRVVCLNEFSDVTARVWQMYQKLNMPMRMVLVPAKDLLTCESLRAEIQIWAPSLKRFLRVGHVACVDDFVSRRLMCYHSDTPNEYKQFQFIQMVYGEVLDVTRLLAIMLEHNNAAEMDALRLPDFGTNTEMTRGGEETEGIFKLGGLMFGPEDIVSRS